MPKQLFVLAIFCCLPALGESIKINLNQLKTNLEEKLNVTGVTFEKAEFSESTEFGIADWLMKKTNFNFKFARLGNVMTAKCISRRNTPKEDPGLYIKCKTYNSENKESPLTNKGEISQVSQVLDGIHPIVTFPRDTSKPLPAPKRPQKVVQ